MNLPADHEERIERARLSLEGLAIGDAFGEMLSYNCVRARERVEKGLMEGPWFHTDDTEIEGWQQARERFDFEENP